MKLINFCNRIIEYSFYGLFLLVPLVFWKDTSELFEMNKMWLVWIITIIIAMAWFTKMVLQKKFFFQRTPLDIPIGLFLLSQIISTFFSLDPHVSLWGYYSRFNGGLLSTISYIFLYYAFLSNFQTNAVNMVKRSLFLSFTCGLIVALWGFPSHFGYDPTCLVFRGTFDVSCWTADFMPRVRIFSTLGQPDWLAAYLAILLPIALAYVISNLEQKIRGWKLYAYVSLVVLFYIDILYTLARSGFLAIWLSLIFFAFTYFWMERKKIQLSLSVKTFKSPLSIFILGLLLITFIIGTPFTQLNTFTLDGIGKHFQKIQAPKTANISTPAQEATQPVNTGGTKSGDIRLLVWTGAINAWKANPIFGTGVETFAFAYYKYKPAGQNLTSEWDFLYNKAHNEYLNYLATTGLFGFGTYLLMIGYFLFLAFRKISKSEFLISNQSPNPKPQLDQLGFRSIRNLVLGLLAAYISILITNFFGFSVVITNVYLFMIPAFVFVLTQQLKKEITPVQANKPAKIENGTSVWQWTPIFFIFVIGLYMLIMLYNFWQADIAYALGANLDRAGNYQQAYPNLHKAVELRGNEPVFKDELSVNDAILATSLVSQKNKDTPAQTVSIANSLAQEAINTSNEVISQYPNNAVFWKTRVRLFYTLSQVDSRYLSRALDAIQKVSLIAPNDAKIWYNLGVLYGQNNNLDQGISALEKTVELKPDYRDAHYGLGLFYHQKAIDKNGNVTDPASQEKAIAQMQYILKNLSPKDQDAQKSIENWAK